MKHALICFALVEGISATALAAPPKVMNDRVVDEYGMTLYVFDKDSPGKSMCMEGCASKWPPAMADSMDKASGNWSFVARDGKQQWAYKGKPLYRWSMDKKAGDAFGDGFNGLWHVAKP